MVLFLKNYSLSGLNKYLHCRVRGKSFELIDKKIKLWLATKQHQIMEVFANGTFEAQLNWSFINHGNLVEEDEYQEDPWCRFTIGAIFPTRDNLRSYPSNFSRPKNEDC